MEKITKKELEDQILHGIAVDIFKAERAYALFTTLGAHGEAIKESRGFSELFRAIQDSWKDEFLLAIARLFDTPSNKYPTRCITGLLQFLAKNSTRLPDIIEQPNLFKTMIDVGFDHKAVHDLQRQGNGANISLAILSHFNNKINSHNTQLLLTKLKELRDKRLAHNELLVESPERMEQDDVVVTFKDLFSLVAIAKNLVGVVGWAYMSMVFMHNGQYRLSIDAERPKFALTRLIKGLGTIEKTK